MVCGLMVAGSLAATMAACGGDDANGGGETPDAGPVNNGNDSGPTGSEGGTTTDSGGGDATTGPTTVATGPTRGSAIALSADDSTLVVANRDSGSVTVFSVTFNGTSPPTVTKKAEVAVGAEPWQVAITPDGTKAYAILRKDQQLVEITGVNGAAPAKGRTVATGSEPTGLALSPTGATAWVANWVDGTVLGFDTAGMTKTSTIDLNATLAKSGMVGDNVASRPAIAHPRSIAITNNGDINDDDESMIVTEYYAQRKVALASDFSNADAAKQGIVYKVKLADKSVSMIPLAPLAGISDVTTPTDLTGAGCFPNQLQSVTISGTLAYVTSICASPAGPLEPRADTHGAVSVVDIAAGAEVAGGSDSLNHRFEKFFTTNTFADDATRRYPSVPSDLAFVSSKSVAYVAANGADSVFRVVYDASGKITTVGTDKARPYIDLLNGQNGQKGAFLDAAHQGKNPVGIATTNAGNGHEQFAFVANDVSRNVSVIDFQTQDVAGDVAADGGTGTSVIASSDLPAVGTPAAKVLAGRRLFNTGVARWSRNGQAWQACQSCHMDGLSDNVTWKFARGPRQSVSLDGSFSKSDPTNQRVFNWTGVFDEVADFEGNTRTVSGGKGAVTDGTDTPIAPGATTNDFGLEGSMLAQSDPANPQGLATAGSRPDWLNITAYVQQIRSPKKPTNLDATLVAAGKTEFTTNRCNGCHGADDKWTVSKLFYAPTTANSDLLATTTYTFPGTIFDPKFDPATNHTLRTGAIAAGPPVADATSIQCVLRNVGTFNVDDGFMGIAELNNAGAAGQGGAGDSKGFNPPSLLGLSVGAPYYHAGQAATLEATFADGFASHHAVVDPNFLVADNATDKATHISQLVQYLLSIDASEPAQSLPASGALSALACPATFP
jgi:DNA-binding beta-propeller fold protein YncE/mono/diheme cytochrome c family protein